MRGVLAWILVAAGAAMIAYPLLLLRFSSAAQARLAADAEGIDQQAAGGGPSLSLAATFPLAEGALLGTIEIPSIGLEAAFVEGISDETLLAAPGHLPETALPGTRGASVVAAHRDLHFRDLHRVEIGDPVRIAVPSGILRYRVERVDVVPPDAGWVTAPTAEPALRLVTCWPPGFLGPAPDRLVVTAAPARPPPERPSETRRTAGPPVVAAGLVGTPVPAAGSATAGAVTAVMAVFAAARGRRDRSTFAALCLGAVVTAVSLAAGVPHAP